MMDIIISMGLTGVMLAMLGMGLLISYYGSSKTRNVGLVFLAIGIGLVYYITFVDVSAVEDTPHFGDAFIAFLGGMLGGIIGIVIFLVAIIKS